MKKNAFRATSRQALIIILILCLSVGAVIGAVAGFGGYASVSGSLNAYLSGFMQAMPEPMDVFRESALKYGKLFIFIWLLAFLHLPIGGLAATLLLIFRGAAYGFSTAALISGYGLAGLACAAILYLPQSLLLLPAYVFAAYACVSFIQKSGEIRSYLPVLAVGTAVSLTAGFIDAFIVPVLVRLILGQ